MPRPHPPVSFEEVGEPARRLKALMPPILLRGEGRTLRLESEQPVAPQRVLLSRSCLFLCADFYCFFPPSFLYLLLFCSLSACKLGPDSGKVLAKALETNGSLKELM